MPYEDLRAGMLRYGALKADDRPALERQPIAESFSAEGTPWLTDEGEIRAGLESEQCGYALWSARQRGAAFRETLAGWLKAGGVDPARVQHSGRLNRLEQAVLEAPDKIVIVRGGQHPIALAPALERIEIRTFVVVLKAETLKGRPVQQILRAIERKLPPAQIERHDVALKLVAPDDLRVAVALGDMRQDRPRIFDERLAAVGAVGQPLRERRALVHPSAAARRRVEQQKRRVLVPPKAGQIALVDHRRAGIHRAVLVLKERLASVLPVDKIAAHGVPPVHIAPHRVGGGMLIEQMIPPLIVNEAVGIVDPAARRGEVRRRAQLFAIQAGIVRLIDKDRLKIDRRLCGERHLLPDIIAQIVGQPVIGFGAQARVQLDANRARLVAQQELFSLRLRADGDEHLALFNPNFHGRFSPFRQRRRAF